MSKDNQRNVTLGKVTRAKIEIILIDTQTKYFPCPICKKKQTIKYTKKFKPYIICNSCGVQLFIRNKEGIEKFMRMIIS